MWCWCEEGEELQMNGPIEEQRWKFKRPPRLVDGQCIREAFASDVAARDRVRS